jgi:hypothetical protein
VISERLNVFILVIIVSVRAFGASSNNSISCETLYQPAENYLSTEKPLYVKRVNSTIERIKLLFDQSNLQYQNLSIEDFFVYINSKFKDKLIIARGVAPKEAYFELLNYKNRTNLDGRKRGLESYGINNTKVKPLFVVNDEFEPSNQSFFDYSFFGGGYSSDRVARTVSVKEVHSALWNNLSYYALVGSKLEFESGVSNPLTLIVDSIPKGWILFYEIPKNTNLKHFPEANVASILKPRVIDFPENSKLIGMIPQSFYDTISVKDAGQYMDKFISFYSNYTINNNPPNFPMVLGGLVFERELSSFIFFN